MLSVREFIRQVYRLISANNPTQPLHGDNLNLGIKVLNQLLQSYAATGLLLTVAKDATTPVIAGQREIICGPSTYVPTPDIPLGRLANLDNAWLILEGVTYPLQERSRSEYLSSWKYDPLTSLPRFIIVFPEIDVVKLRLYPAPSQQFDFHMRAKFQLDELTSNDDMSIVPQYYHRYLLFASAKDIAMYTGRSEAWTEKLEMMLQKATDDMVNTSEVNLDVQGSNAVLLNGSWRAIAGV